MSATLADILQDARAFAAACEELAEHLDAMAARLKAPDALETLETGFLRVLPLMCVFASPDAMAAFAAHLRGIAARLDALPASADDLAKVMTAPAAEFEAFEALVFNHRHVAMIPGVSGIPETPASGSTRVDPSNEQNVLSAPAKDAHGQKGGPLL